MTNGVRQKSAVFEINMNAILIMTYCVKHRRRIDVIMI